MKVEVTVTVTVEAGDGWNERVDYALCNVASQIYHCPQYIEQKGEGTDFTFEYTMKGVE